jgi:hypothetical protein
MYLILIANKTNKKTANVVPYSSILVTLIMEAIPSSEASVLTRTTRRNIPEEDTLYNNPVLTSQVSHHVSATEPNQLMLFRETVTVSHENRTENSRDFFGQSVSHRKHVASPLQSQTG